MAREARRRLRAGAAGSAAGRGRPRPARTTAGSAAGRRRSRGCWGVCRARRRATGRAVRRPAARRALSRCRRPRARGCRARRRRARRPAIEPALDERAAIDSPMLCRVNALHARSHPRVRRGSRFGARRRHRRGRAVGAELRAGDIEHLRSTGRISDRLARFPVAATPRRARRSASSAYPPRRSVCSA